MRKIVDVLERAVEDGRAVAAINAPGFDAMVGIGKAARHADQPVIIQTSARLVRNHGARTVHTWFDTAKRISRSECYLHLDHCQDDEILHACITSGWDMVMFDGSSFPIEENVARSRALAIVARANGVAIEGEVGAVGGEEDGHQATPNVASADDIASLAAEGQIDCIAIGFGNVHGDYASTAHLHWDVYESAHALAKVPLVLHGGTGLSDAEFLRAVRAGTAKINISTELKKAYARVVLDNRLHEGMPKNPGILHDLLEEAAFNVALHHITLFGSFSKLEDK
jgi:fructose-bisphosphate aldolase class II